MKFVMKPMTFHVFNINVVFFRYNTKKDAVKHYLIPIYTFYLLDFFPSGSFDIWCIAITKVQQVIIIIFIFTFYTGAETFISNTLVTTKINLRLFYNVLGT